MGEGEQVDVETYSCVFGLFGMFLTLSLVFVYGEELWQ